MISIMSRNARQIQSVSQNVLMVNSSIIIISVYVSQNAHQVLVSHVGRFMLQQNAHQVLVSNVGRLQARMIHNLPLVQKKIGYNDFSVSDFVFQIKIKN